MRFEIYVETPLWQNAHHTKMLKFDIKEINSPGMKCRLTDMTEHVM